ncbi:hypothetical protein OP10G_1974 [Fimbriimonas ginsengisoli Gsoil 348]|uniref:Uncharacterized protein n=1 Tax=Fimbriimonas ginsengisoli Gsoil 348 TaxID=661478 RepID=A0A068NPN8_FIMGI|nr:hypothetical protein OP10G_1974 [Fimbriimonas ginsengisoli Gsoil 348]
MLSGLASVLMAQAPFTIVRPADGSRVREKVHILIPKGSIPTGGYVGVFLNGHLIEAVVPPLVGKYYEYVLDTKGRGIADTPAGKTDKLELVLYADSDDKSRIVDRSSVDVKIGNEANIAVPNSGLKLRYKFVPGQDMVYNLTQFVQVQPMSEEDNANGGKAATFETEGERIRLLYSVTNAYGNGDGLLRMQALPEKGKDYADLTAASETTQKRYYDTDMAPLYMRVTTTGHEVFGALPAYVAFESPTGSVNTVALFAAFPLPTLPTKPVRPGDSWQSRFQRGALDLNNWTDMKSVVKQFPARGEFVNVEWEGGHPCAKIRNVIQEGTMSLDDKKLAAKGAQFAGDKVGITETIWFAMDTHQILKIQRDMKIDQKVENGGGGFGGSPFGGGGGGPAGVPGRPGGFGPPGGDPTANGGGGRGDFHAPVSDIRQQGIPRGPKGGFGGKGGFQGGPPSGFGGPGGPGFPGSGMGRQGAPTSQATFVRIHILQTFTLEK